MAVITAPAPVKAEAGVSSKTSRKLRDNLTGHAFLIGAVLCFGLFMWFPMIRGIVMSFQRTRRGVTTWVGWDNYIRIIEDPSFWVAWKNTFYWVATTARILSASRARPDC